MCLVNSLYACHPSSLCMALWAIVSLRAQSWFCFTWFHIWTLKWKKRLFKLTLIPARWLASHNTTMEAPGQLIQLSSTKVFTFMSTILFNFFPQFVKLYELKTHNSHLRMVNIRYSLSGLLSRAFTQLLCLKCWATMKVPPDFCRCFIGT